MEKRCAIKKYGYKVTRGAIIDKDRPLSGKQVDKQAGTRKLRRNRRGLRRVEKGVHKRYRRGKGGMVNEDDGGWVAVSKFGMAVK